MYRLLTHKLTVYLLIISIFICAFSVESFADTGNNDILAQDMSYEAYFYNSQNGTFDSLNVSRTVLDSWNNLPAVRYTVSANSVGGGKTLSVYEFKNFKADHEYNISFSIATAYASSTNFVLYLRIYDGNGSLVESQTLVSTSFVSNNTWKNINVNFKPDLTNVTTGYSIKLDFLFVASNNGSQNNYISQHIYLNDNDDDSGWFQSIVQWLQNIASDISSLGTSIGSWFSQLGTNISNGLTSLGNTLVSNITSLGNSISTWLSNLGTAITNKLQTVQTAITNAIDGVQQWFINLGNRIGEFFTMLKNYILYFQHPVTLNADGVPVDSNGEPVYVNPFTDTLENITDTLDDVFDDLDGFISTIQSVNVQITGYLNTFTTLFNRFNAGVPIMGILISLALIIIVIRKILGR